MQTAISDQEIRESKIDISLEDKDVEKLYDEYIELSSCELNCYKISQIFQLLLKYLVNLKDPLIPSNLLPSLVHKFKHAEPAYRRASFLKEVLVNDLPVACSAVVRHVLQLLHKCFFWENDVVPSELETLLFSSFFGDPDKKLVNDLRTIFKLILKFPGFWYGVSSFFLFVFQKDFVTCL